MRAVVRLSLARSFVFLVVKYKNMSDRKKEGWVFQTKKVMKLLFFILAVGVSILFFGWTVALIIAISILLIFEAFSSGYKFYWLSVLFSILLSMALIELTGMRWGNIAGIIAALVCLVFIILPITDKYPSSKKQKKAPAGSSDKDFS